MKKTKRTLQLLRGWQATQDVAATIGNFDGVHQGHQALVSELVKMAKAEKLRSRVVSFTPLPSEYFAPEHAPPRLSNLRDKVRRLKICKLDELLLLRFDKALAMMPAEEFAQRLFERLRTRVLWVGDDFRFGAKRVGDYQMLRDIGTRFGAKVERMGTKTHLGERISSSSLRAALGRGEMEQALALIGSGGYSIPGRVVHGDKLGRQLGVPTLNIRHKLPSCALRGVFVVGVSGVRGVEGELFGVANVGVRPTVNGDELRVEVHVLDWQGDAYGSYVRVRFMQRLREERRFDSLDELKGAIHSDIVDARTYLGRIFNDTWLRNRQRYWLSQRKPF